MMSDYCKANKEEHLVCPECGRCFNNWLGDYDEHMEKAHNSPNVSEDSK